MFFVPLFIVGEVLFVLILSIDLQNALFVRLSFFLSSSFRGLALNQKFVVVVEVLHVEERLVGHAEGGRDQAVEDSGFFAHQFLWPLLLCQDVFEILDLEYFTVQIEWHVMPLHWPAFKCVCSQGGLDTVKQVCLSLVYGCFPGETLLICRALDKGHGSK